LPTFKSVPGSRMPGPITLLFHVFMRWCYVAERQL
jgi:hypothetical protein